MEKDTELTVAGLAHDLNNVFETLSEAVELINQDPKYAKIAGRMRRSVALGTRIVESITETARDAAEFDKLLDNAILHAEDFLLVAHGPRVSWSRSVESGLRLPGSGAAWERVLVNLFLNAAQSMPEEVTVEVCARVGGDCMMFTVADDGPGIPDANLPHIFEPHFSTKKTRGKWVRTGLGLHIVSTIVSEHGGKVQAENRSPRGAIFTISLPVAGC